MYVTKLTNKKMEIIKSLKIFYTKWNLQKQKIG